jgi:hypothetical protein
MLPEFKPAHISDILLAYRLVESERRRFRGCQRLSLESSAKAHADYVCNSWIKVHAPFCT